MYTEFNRILKIFFYEGFLAFLGKINIKVRINENEEGYLEYSSYYFRNR